MTCGCCNNIETSPDNDQQCCICHPYKDGFLMTAQILSIIAFCMSWTWWPTFVLSAPVMISLQVVWCCKMKKPGLIAMIILSFICFLASLFTGIWMLVDWKGTSYCPIFVLFEKYDNPSSYDGCREGAWASVAFLECILFFFISYFTWYFVRYRFDVVGRAEETQDQNHVSAVEMRVASAPSEVASSVVATATLLPVSPLEKV